MRIEADVSRDGVLTARVPDRYRGKHVRISIQEAEGTELPQWTALTEILAEIESYEIPRRSHRNILDALREFRETE